MPGIRDMPYCQPVGIRHSVCRSIGASVAAATMQKLLGLGMFSWAGVVDICYISLGLAGLPFEAKMQRFGCTTHEQFQSSTNTCDR
jgi:hypothetical protein